MSHWMNHTRHILGSVILGAAAALTCLFAVPSSAKGDLDIPREFAINASQVETGLLYNSHDSYKFGDFLGLDDERIYWLGHMDLRGRRRFDSDSPIFWRLRASNLGLDSRSIDIEYGQQGRFAFNLNYDEIPKYQIDDAYRYYGGNGGSVMVTPPGWVAADETSGLTELNSDLRDLDIDHKRKNMGVGLSLIPLENWKFTARFDRNLKQGTKLQSALIGSSGGNPRASLVPESIDYDTRKFDANLEYAVDQGQFRINYNVSSFHNRNDSLTFDTPYLCPGGACGAGSWNAAAEWPTGQGRKGLAPDNRFDQLTFSGGYNLPAKTRLTMNAAFGRMKQDETFLPYTVNPGLSVTTPLPRNSFDGEVRTTALDLRITSRPQPKLSLNASYRYDDRDNKSSTDTYIYVPGDAQDQGAIDSSTARINATEDYKKNELELGARYKLFKRTDLTLEYEYEMVDRNDAEVDTTRENMYRMKLRTRPMDRVSTAFNIGHSRRRASTYHDNAPFLETHSPDYIATQSGVGLWENHPLLRRYYLNDRDRTEVGVSTTYMPTDTLSVGFNVNYRNDDFNDPTVGLTNRRMTNYMLDVSYAPTDKTQAHAFYSHENTRFDQAGWYFAGFAKAAMSADPDNRWWSKAKDRVHTLGFGVKTNLIEDKLDLVVDYLYSQSRDEIHMNGKVTAGDPAFPDTVSRLHDLRVGLEYKLRENLSVRVGYLFEKFSLDDWAYDGILPDSIDELITIGEESPDYKSHLVTWSFVYKFW